MACLKWAFFCKSAQMKKLISWAINNLAPTNRQPLECCTVIRIIYFRKHLLRNYLFIFIIMGLIIYKHAFHEASTKGCRDRWHSLSMTTIYGLFIRLFWNCRWFEPVMTLITKMCLLRSHYIFKDRIQLVGDTTIDCSQNLVLKRFNKTTKLPISFHLLFHNNDT